MPVAAAIAGAAVIGGVTSVISGNKAANAERDAATQASAASERATQLQIEEARRQYDTTRADYAPYRDVGYGALNRLASMYGVATSGTGAGSGAAGSSTLGYANDGGFTASPGYQFRMDEGLKAIDRSAAARGVLNSGGADKARIRYAQGLASSEYDNYASRIAQLAGVGQAATGSTAAAGQNASNAITNAYGVNGQNQGNAAMAAGNARASSYANTGSAINGTVNNLASLYLFNNAGGFGGKPIAPGSYGIYGSDGVY